MKFSWYDIFFGLSINEIYRSKIIDYSIGLGTGFLITGRVSSPEFIVVEIWTVFSDLFGFGDLESFFMVLS